MHDQPDHQDVEGGQAAMHQHLVDHHLEEQRRQQREDLQEERGGEHFAEDPAVFPHRAEKPAEVEAVSEIAERGAARGQDELAGPVCREVGDWQDARLLCGRIDNQYAIGRRLGEQDARAVVVQGNGREWDRGEALHGAANGPRAQAGMPQVADHIADRRNTCTEGLSDLRRLRCQPVEPQQRNKCADACDADDRIISGRAHVTAR